MVQRGFCFSLCRAVDNTQCTDQPQLTIFVVSAIVFYHSYDFESRKVCSLEDATDMNSWSILTSITLSSLNVLNFSRKLWLVGRCRNRPSRALPLTSRLTVTIACLRFFFSCSFCLRFFSLYFLFFLTEKQHERMRTYDRCPGVYCVSRLTLSCASQVLSVSRYKKEVCNMHAHALRKGTGAYGHFCPSPLQDAPSVDPTPCVHRQRD